MRYSGSRFDRGGFSVSGGPVTLSLFFLVLVAILLLFVHRADPSLFERWRTKIVDVSSPVLETLSWPVNVARNTISDISEFWAVYEENKRLKKEIDDLKVWQSAALHYERQIAQYEKLMKVQPLPGIEYVTARLIADGGSPFKHTFIVNAGANQGISNGQGVVDGLDLIGRVVNVGERSSRVLRVTDINSRIPVMVEPSRQRAIMAGDNSSQPKLEFVESELDIRAGDRVVTSGDGGLLPPGLPIGEVVQQEAGKFRVKPRTSHNRFEAVRVVRFNFPVDVDSGVEEEAPADSEGAPDADSGETQDGGPVADSHGGEEGEPATSPDAQNSQPARPDGHAEPQADEPSGAAAPVRAAQNQGQGNSGGTENAGAAPRGQAGAADPAPADTSPDVPAATDGE